MNTAGITAAFPRYVAACFFGLVLQTAVPAMAHSTPLIDTLDRWLLSVPLNSRFCDFGFLVGGENAALGAAATCQGPSSPGTSLAKLTKSGAFDDFFIDYEPKVSRPKSDAPVMADAWYAARQRNQDLYFRNSTKAKGIRVVLQVYFDPALHEIAVAQSWYGDGNGDEFFVEAGIPNPPIPVRTRALGGLASNHGLRIGSTMDDVAHIFGKPSAVLRKGSLTEWGYDIRPARSEPSEARYFIFKAGRVYALQYGAGD